MPRRFCGQGTVEQNISELMKIGRCIATVTNQPVKLHRQLINGPKTEHLIAPGLTAGYFSVAITTIEDGRERARVKIFISWIDLLEYLAKNYRGKGVVKLAYYAEHINSGRPFYFQTYNGGVVM